MATVYFDVDYCLSVIKPNHRAFYKRVFHSIRIDRAAVFRKLQQQYRAACANARELQRTLFDRYPFFRSQPHERKMMFAPREVLGLTPLTILPTARYVIENAT
jgi:hypothetical protein